jgi:hypothetical protein
MPSSLIVVALVVAWLAVLVPMVVRKRQEIAKTADSALASRVLRSGNAEEVEEEPARTAEQIDRQPVSQDEVSDQVTQRAGDVDRARAAKPARAYRPGRGGFDPKAAAISARAKYALRQRVVLLLILGAVVSGVVAGALFPLVWWGHGALDIVLVGYLTYLRRQARIEEAIRARRLARMSAARRAQPPSIVAEVDEAGVEEEPDDGAGRRALVSDGFGAPPPRSSHPTAVVVEVDDEDPIFDELEQPDNLPYRRAAGE